MVGRPIGIVAVSLIGMVVVAASGLSGPVRALLAAALGVVVLGLVGRSGQARAREATTAAEELEWQLETVVATAHELLNPVTSLQGFVELLSTGRVEGRDEIVETLGAEVRHLKGIVNGLLTTARLRNDVPAEQAEVDLLRQAEVAADSFVFDGKVVVISGEPLVAWAEELRVQQVLRNLISNAIRYGGPTIWVETTERDDRVGVVVRDDGDTTPKWSLTADARSDDMVRPVDSMGMGLTISARLAESMGGEVTLERADGVSSAGLFLPPVGPSVGSDESATGSP